VSVKLVEHIDDEVLQTEEDNETSQRETESIIKNIDSESSGDMENVDVSFKTIETIQGEDLLEEDVTSRPESIIKIFESGTDSPLAYEGSGNEVDNSVELGEIEAEELQVVGEVLRPRADSIIDIEEEGSGSEKIERDADIDDTNTEHPLSLGLQRLAVIVEDFEETNSEGSGGAIARNGETEGSGQGEGLSKQENNYVGTSSLEEIQEGGFMVVSEKHDKDNDIDSTSEAIPRSALIIEVDTEGSGEPVTRNEIREGSGHNGIELIREHMDTEPEGSGQGSDVIVKAENEEVEAPSEDTETEDSGERVSVKDYNGVHNAEEVDDTSEENEIEVSEESVSNKNINNQRDNNEEAEISSEVKETENAEDLEESVSVKDVSADAENTEEVEVIPEDQETKDSEESISVQNLQNSDSDELNEEMIIEEAIPASHKLEEIEIPHSNIEVKQVEDDSIKEISNEDISIESNLVEDDVSEED